MAIPGQPLQGGLGAMAPKPPVANLTANPAQPSEAKDAARVSAMEQDTILSPEEVARKAMVDRKAQSEALEAQLQLLTQSLDARMNPGYNVPLMNLAAGLLKPTRTGSFGESLGYGLENYSKSSQDEMAQKQLIEKQKLEYMQKLADIQKQRGLLDYQLAEMGGSAPTVLRTGAESAPVGAPAPVTQALGEAGRATPPMVGNAPPAINQTGVQGSSRPMTIDRAKMAGAMDDKLGEAAWKQLEAERRQIELQLSQTKSAREGMVPTQFGMWDADKKEWVEKDPYIQKAEKFDFGPFNPPGQDGRLASQKQIREYQAIDKIDTNALIKFAVAQGWLAPSALPPSAGPAPAGGGAAPAVAAPVGGAAPAGKPGVDPLGRRSTVPSQDALENERLAREAEQAKVLENQKLDITDNAKIRQGIYQAGRDSYGQVLSSEQLYRLATDPKTSGAFGVLQGNDIKSAILGAIAEGVQTPGGSIKFGGIEDAVRKINGTKEEVNAALQAARYYAELELNYARTYLKGQGAVSDNERKIVGKIGGSLSDTPQVAAAKAETMMARSAYDKQLSDVYYQWEQKNPGKMVKEFERTPEFTKLQSQFNEHMGLLNEKYFPSSASRPPAATPAPAAAPPAASPAPAAPRTQSPLDRFNQERARRAAQGNQ